VQLAAAAAHIKIVQPGRIDLPPAKELSNQVAFSAVEEQGLLSREAIPDGVFEQLLIRGR
jgi:hypothetical protein